MNLPVQFLSAMLSDWMNRLQHLVIDYMKEGNRLLREQLRGRLLRWTDAQRRRLAEKGKVLGRAALMELATIVKPDTIFRWHRDLRAVHRLRCCSPDTLVTITVIVRSTLVILIIVITVFDLVYVYRIQHATVDVSSNVQQYTSSLFGEFLAR